MTDHDPLATRHRQTARPHGWTLCWCYRCMQAKSPTATPLGLPATLVAWGRRFLRRRAR